MTDFELAQSLKELMEHISPGPQRFAKSLVNQFQTRGFLSKKQCLIAKEIVSKAQATRANHSKGGRHA